MCAAIENWNSLPVTLNTPKRPANVIANSSTSSQSGTNSENKDQKKRSLPKSTTLSAFKQTCGGIEDFFLLREGQVDSLKSSTNGLCTPPSNRRLF